MFKTLLTTLSVMLAIALAFALGLLLTRIGGDVAGAAPPSPQRPHVILVTIDTLRADHMSAYGYERDTTPNIQKFFGESYFENARASAPCTVPSVKQLLTGRLDAEGPTLARVLSGEGYSTAAIVSQHQFIDDAFAYADGFDHWDPSRTRDQHNMTARDARELTDRALAFLEQHMHDQKPFFLWLHFIDPHDPYNPPIESRRYGRVVSSFEDGDRRTPQFARQRNEAFWYLVDHIFSEEDRDNLRKLYDDEIRYVDEQLGRVLNVLDREPFKGRSLVVLGADHGERLGENAAWDHCYSLHDLELRVPLLMKGFRLEVSTAVKEHAVSNLDIMPTILGELAIKTKDLGLDGRQVWSRDRPKVTAVFQEQAMIADSFHKLYVSTTNGGCTPTSLIELNSGAELGGRELSLPDYPDLSRSLANTLCKERLKLERTVELTERDLERLRALGYTQ